MYTQRLLLRADHTARQDTVWIPDEFAEEGRDLLIRKRGETVGYHARVLKVYGTTERDMAKSEMLWTKQRSVSDL